MVHPIYVCLECKITMHTCRNVGIHCISQHKTDYIQAEKEGIVVKIDDCNPQSTSFGRCPSPRDKPATDFELQAAKRILENARAIHCEFCGRELKDNVPLSDPNHIFNKPSSEGHKKTCRKCFNRS